MCSPSLGLLASSEAIPAGFEALPATDRERQRETERQTDRQRERGGKEQERSGKNR